MIIIHSYVFIAKLVNVKEIEDLLKWEADDDNTFIGRFDTKTGLQSKWGNPYRKNIFGRRKCIDMYLNYILTSDLLNDLIELKGKTLGCFCYPKECHGDVLLYLTN